MKTRRHFLRDCSLVAATAAVAPVSGWTANSRMRELAPDSSLFGGFAGVVNSPFSVQTSSGVVKLVLAQASPAAPALPGAEDDGNERFSLFFRGSNREPLDQGSYLFEHPRLGRLPIFIARIGSLDPADCWYEAVFNHAVSPQELSAQLARAPRPIPKD